MRLPIYISAFAALVVPISMQAVVPVVKTVPWVASNPLIPHDIVAGTSTRLKGTCDQFGASMQYVWDFGDGSSVVTGAIATSLASYGLEASHVYAGSVGQTFVGTLTCRNTSTGEQASRSYYLQIRAAALAAATLGVRVNIAIDEGLWYLHKSMSRSVSGATPGPAGLAVGSWRVCPGGSCVASTNHPSITAANTQAFEVNGHLEGGSPDNPYTETVQRGMRQIFNELQAIAVPGTQTNGSGIFNPDTNGNGYGALTPSTFESFYEMGQLMDAIIASGTPNAVTVTGATAPGPGIRSRQYKDVVQDMADYLSFCQSDSGFAGGSWYYTCNQSTGDNSIGQWVAIGLIPAQRTWNLVVPAAVRTFQNNWLANSYDAVNRWFGYQGPTPLWGPYATTPSGLVQLALHGKGRGDGRWDGSETRMRDNFGNAGFASLAPKGYYYGLFSLVKSMLLHDSNGDAVAEPLTLLQSSTPGVAPLDWYGAETPSAPTNGVAKTLVVDQNALGYWTGHNYTSEQYPYETAWAIIMLNRTLFESGAPVAVAKATPNPGIANAVITLDGTGSFHQDPAKQIVAYAWDLNNDGVYETPGSIVTTSFGAVGSYTVRLRVTDNAGTPALASTAINVIISLPPVAPSANARGPAGSYNFCIGKTPWFLNGTLSVNPDQGLSEPGRPGDTIISYEWDFLTIGAPNSAEASGVQPDVTAILGPAGAPNNYLVQLKVTDQTSVSYPSSGQPNLFGVDTAQVFVRAATDPACTCVANLSAAANATGVSLTWTGNVPGTIQSAVYRATTSGGPYAKIGTVTGSSYFDGTAVLNTTYYYVVRPIGANTLEICSSNQASGTPRRR